MRTKDFVHSYFEAWNHADAEGVADHLARDGFYYDIPEHTQRRHDELVDWLQEFFARGHHRYELLGEVVAGRDTLAFQYRMIPERQPGTDAAEGYHGAEFVKLCDDGALVITDYYDVPQAAPLASRATPAQQAKYAKSGLDERQLDTYKARLEEAMCGQKVFLQPDLTLPQLARLVGCSVNHLSQVINAGFGTSFFDFLNLHRIEHARGLLASKDDRNRAILNIAYAVGFNSNSAFYAAFKKHVGRTPANYRREMQGGGH